MASDSLNGFYVPVTAPAKATDAVLVASDPVPEDAQPVHGIEFDRYKDADVSAAELVANMSSMGFQASSIGDAVEIINRMVRWNSLLPRCFRG